MLFDKLDADGMGKVREEWNKLVNETDSDLLNLALDAAEVRASGEREGMEQYALIESVTGNCLALASLTHVHPKTEQSYIKILDICFSPNIGFDIDSADMGQYKTIGEALGHIIAKAMALAAIRKASSVKIYGKSKNEAMFFCVYANNAEAIKTNWSIEVSSHGKWLQFTLP